jgi:hypothetical protein
VYVCDNYKDFILDFAKVSQRQVLTYFVEKQDEAAGNFPEQILKGESYKTILYMCVHLYKY